MSYQADMYYYIMVYDCDIAYAFITFIIIEMKVVWYNISYRKLWHTKYHLYIMCGAVRSCGCTIFYIIRSKKFLVRVNISLFIMMLEDPLSHRHVSTKVTIFMEFFSPLRRIVTTGCEYLIGIYMLQLLSNLSVLSRKSSTWLFYFMLLSTPLSILLYLFLGCSTSHSLLEDESEELDSSIIEPLVI